MTTEIYLLISALGGLGGVGAIIQAIHKRPRRRIRVESTAITELAKERDKAYQARDVAVASEREAWERADAMEARYDRAIRSRNRWRERSHLQDLWHATHCSGDTDEYPPLIEEDD